MAQLCHDLIDRVLPAFPGDLLFLGKEGGDHLIGAGPHILFFLVRADQVAVLLHQVQAVAVHQQIAVSLPAGVLDPRSAQEFFLQGSGGEPLQTLQLGVLLRRCYQKAPQAALGICVRKGGENGILLCGTDQGAASRLALRPGHHIDVDAA